MITSFIWFWFPFSRPSSHRMWMLPQDSSTLMLCKPNSKNVVHCSTSSSLMLVVVLHLCHIFCMRKYCLRHNPPLYLSHLVFKLYLVHPRHHLHLYSLCYLGTLSPPPPAHPPHLLRRLLLLHHHLPLRLLLRRCPMLVEP